MKRVDVYFRAGIAPLRMSGPDMEVSVQDGMLLIEKWTSGGPAGAPRGSTYVASGEWAIAHVSNQDRSE
jgi:hypothetical protein